MHEDFIRKSLPAALQKDISSMRLIDFLYDACNLLLMVHAIQLCFICDCHKNQLSDSNRYVCFYNYINTFHGKTQDNYSWKVYLTEIIKLNIFNTATKHTQYHLQLFLIFLL